MSKKIAKTTDDAPLLQGDLFWKDGRAGYALLSYFSNKDDWDAILGFVAYTIASFSTHKGVIRILDIGAGLGLSSFSISKRLLTSNRIMTRWALWEPDAEARAAARLLFPEGLHNYGSAEVVADERDIPEDDKFDVFLFLHSAYYIRDLRGLLKRLVETRASPNARFIFLSMREDSPFFVGKVDHGHVNLPGEIRQIMQDAGLRVEISELSSRLVLPPDVWSNDDVLEQFIRATHLRNTPLTEARRLLRLYLQDGVDLRDALVVGTKAS